MRSLLWAFTGYAAVLPLFTRLSLWRYLALTVGIALAVALATVGTFVGVMLQIEWSSMFSAGWLGEVGLLVTALAGLSLSVILYKRIVLVLASPWMSIVAERVTSYYGVEAHPTPPSSYRLLRRSFRLNARLLVRELLLSLPLFALSLIPVFNLATLIALFIVQAYFVGAGTLDYSLEQRYDYAGSLRYLRSHRPMAAGVGAGFVLLLFTGVGFLIAPAWSAAAGAYAFAKTERAREATQIARLSQD